MQGAGFLELQCRLLGHGQAVAAADNEQVARPGQYRQGRRPVQREGLFQLLGQGVERVLQRVVAGPGGDDGGQAGQRSDIGLGGGHGAFRSGLQRQEGVGQGRQGAGLVIDQGDDMGAGLLVRLDGRQQVRRSARLRDGDAQTILGDDGGSIDRRHRQRRRRGRHAQQGLDQVLAEGGGVVAGAAGAGGHRARRVGAQVRGQPGQGGLVLVEEAADGRPAFAGLGEHERRARVDDGGHFWRENRGGHYKSWVKRIS